MTDVQTPVLVNRRDSIDIQVNLYSPFEQQYRGTVARGVREIFLGNTFLNLDYESVVVLGQTSESLKSHDSVPTSC